MVWYFFVNWSNLLERYICVVNIPSGPQCVPTRPIHLIWFGLSLRMIWFQLVSYTHYSSYIDILFYFHFVLLSSTWLWREYKFWGGEYTTVFFIVLQGRLTIVFFKLWGLSYISKYSVAISVLVFLIRLAKCNKKKYILIIESPFYGFKHDGIWEILSHATV